MNYRAQSSICKAIYEASTELSYCLTSDSIYEFYIEQFDLD